jgi:MFS family permease
VPLVAVVGGWFTQRRTLAVGWRCRHRPGHLVGAPVAAALIEAYGWRDAYLVLAGVGTVALLVCAALVRAAPVQADAVHVPLRPRLRTPAYVRLYAAGLLLAVALFVPLRAPARVRRRARHRRGRGRGAGGCHRRGQRRRALALGAAAARLRRAADLPGLLRGHRRQLRAVAGQPRLPRGWWPSR